MEQKINIGNVLMNTLNTLILKVFTLPFKIYKNALISLSESISTNNKDESITNEFPIYAWFISIFEALIVITYPLGFLFALYSMFTAGVIPFVTTLVVVYFVPLYFSLLKELLQITLKIVAYLKTISLK